MVTTLGIVLAVVIAVNVWQMIRTAKRERERRKLLQERLDECDERLGEVMNKLGLAKQHLNEAQSLCTALKKENKKILAEYADLKLSYQRAVKERDDVKEKYSALLVKRAELLAEIERLKEDPVDGGEPTAHDQPVEPAGKPLPDFKVDFDELRKSYEELAKSYNAISQKWENPSKTYLVRNLVKVYDVQSRTQLAKVLGVSQQSINQMLRKK